MSIENPSNKTENAVERKNPLLDGPEEISSLDKKKKLKEELNNHVSSFDKGDGLIYRLGNNNGNSYFVIECTPECFEKMDENLQGKFIKKGNVYIFEHGDVPKSFKYGEGSSKEWDYLVEGEKRDFSGQDETTKPQEIKEKDISQLVELLKNKKVLFYSGAGLSMSGNVWGMAELQERMAIDMQKLGADDFLDKAVLDPKEIDRIWKENITNLHNNRPTPAHESLAQLAKKLKSRIFTENHDTLQEETGVKPDKISGPKLRENVQPEWLKDIDAVITVGLRDDDRGFLAWYKKNNPGGKIISINKEQAKYLGDEDIWVSGDLQKIIPELEKIINKNL